MNGFGKKEKKKMMTKLAHLQDNVQYLGTANFQSIVQRVNYSEEIRGSDAGIFTESHKELASDIATKRGNHNHHGFLLRQRPSENTFTSSRSILGM